MLTQWVSQTKWVCSEVTVFLVLNAIFVLLQYPSTAAIWGKIKREICAEKTAILENTYWFNSDGLRLVPAEHQSAFLYRTRTVDFVPHLLCGRFGKESHHGQYEEERLERPRTHTPTQHILCAYTLCIKINLKKMWSYPLIFSLHQIFWRPILSIYLKSIYPMSKQGINLTMLALFWLHVMTWILSNYHCVSLKKMNTALPLNSPHSSLLSINVHIDCERQQNIQLTKQQNEEEKEQGRGAAGSVTY